MSEWAGCAGRKISITTSPLTCKHDSLVLNLLGAKSLSMLTGSDTLSQGKSKDVSCAMRFSSKEEETWKKEMFSIEWYLKDSSR